jgi:hypothetical protein
MPLVDDVPVHNFSVSRDFAVPTEGPSTSAGATSDGSMALGVGTVTVGLSGFWHPRRVHAKFVAKRALCRPCVGRPEVCSPV